MAGWRDIFRKRSPAESIDSLRTKIERFRSLLARNNEVLDSMAQAGEAQGGDLLFDYNYLDKLSSTLAEAVRGVVSDLEQITDGRYPDLREAFDRIRIQIADVLESRPVAPVGPDIIALGDLRSDLSLVAGEKMARLGEIRQQLHFEVPDGFVITSSACASFFSSIELVDHMTRMLEAAGDDRADAAAISRSLGDLIVKSDLPRDLVRAMQKAVAGLRRGTSGPTSFALRSSAPGEDGDLSYAGLHRTFLGVEASEIPDRYREVLASLFTTAAQVYRTEHDEPLQSALMAVGCMRMVQARASGVLYTIDPADPSSDVMVVSASPGLGKTVVEGIAAVDRFTLSRKSPHAVVEREVKRKEEMYALDRDGKVRLQPVSRERQETAAIDDSFLATLATTALRIERYMKTAQDIEWAEDEDGRVVILQARPLQLQADTAAIGRQAQEAARNHRVLISERGIIACRGIAAGTVVIARGEKLPTDLPDDFVLVARQSSPHLAELVPKARAVLTDVGASTGHLATITREFRVPAVVDLGDATERLTEGSVITVDAEESVIYEGRVEELLRYQVLRRSSFEDTREFRLLRRILHHIAPLNLDNPKSDRFRARSCRTYHDIIRFAHEKAVEHFLEGRVATGRKNPHSRRVKMDVPIDLIAIDIGGGLAVSGPGKSCTRDEVSCAPLRALLAGLNAPGAWSTEPAGMDLDSFLASATGPSLLSAPTERTGRNLAIISDCYLNLNLHLGYHFNQVDAYVSETRNDNYAYFRFAGGLTDAIRRARRAKAISIALERQDFVVETRGDFLIARLKKFERDTMLLRMQMLGLLIGFTRQMDVRMRGDSMIDHVVNELTEALNSYNQLY